jgi:hypothetical protein
LGDDGGQDEGGHDPAGRTVPVNADCLATVGRLPAQRSVDDILVVAKCRRLRHE